MAHPDARHAALIAGYVMIMRADDLRADPFPEFLQREVVGPRAHDPAELLPPLLLARLGRSTVVNIIGDPTLTTRAWRRCERKGGRLVRRRRLG